MTKIVFFLRIIGMKYNALKISEIVVVNLITLFRLVGAIILPFIYYNSGTATAAIWILILFLTDAIDGFLARTFKVSTFFGSSMDALSDKMLNAVAFIILGLEYTIMITPLIIEIAIMFNTYSTYRFGGNVQSSKIGKIKTIILDVFVVLSFALLSLPVFNIDNVIINYLIESTSGFIALFGCIITILSIITLIDYNKKNKEVRNNKKLTHIKYQKKIKKNFQEILHTAFDTEYYAKHKDEPIMRQLYKNKESKI